MLHHSAISSRCLSSFSRYRRREASGAVDRQVFRVAGSAIEGPIQGRILCSLRAMLGGDVPLTFPEAGEGRKMARTEEHEGEEVRGYCILLGNFCGALSRFLYPRTRPSLSLSLFLSAAGLSLALPVIFC